MDKFEKIIKEAVEGYEAPYNPSAWDKVSQGLKNPKPFNWFATGTAAVIAVAITIIAVNYNTEDLSVINDNISTSERTFIQENKGLEVSETNDMSLPPIEEEAILTHTDNQENIEISNGKVNKQQDKINEVEIIKISDNERDIPPIISQITPAKSETVVQLNEDKSSLEYNDSKEVTILLEEEYSAEFSLIEDNPCEGQMTELRAERDYNNVLYVWDFGDGNQVIGKDVEYTYANAGSYQINLILKDDRTNKVLTEKSKEVEVKNSPNADFRWETVNNIIPGIKFINQTDRVASTEWVIDGVVTSTNTEFEHTFRKKGVYDVRLVATNPNGCAKTVINEIKIENNYNLYAPRAFSPNGDFLNDNFIPEALKIMDVEFLMTVYNKQGLLLFQTNNVNEPWSGVYKDGSLAPEDGYIWKVKFRNNDGEYATYTGQVFITR